MIEGVIEGARRGMNEEREGGRGGSKGREGLTKNTTEAKTPANSTGM